ncbi:hypothetical protein BCV69DRAFT_296072 [Microstroma glucosiphilum]|uniref:Alpha/beta-hydrolase n=1 Tax=Pseudomicrostroma glucosiphilum TaxID=1684307 RepID=A0A316UET6_9BASI|nr:hypothetical protein BCV69DRAFT_296072 [Pseudomicrostroma glucosiphilum]PWN23756.1 hypothetical protein BCV69DRAFT_296072 [Pseudomicrostroma glucosiphilum]
MSVLSTMSGERLTLPFARRGSSLDLKLDLYPFLHAPSSTSSSSSFPPPSPFVLYVHSAFSNPFFSGSRRDVPVWLLELCEKKGWPLVVGDYRLAPEVGVGEMLEDLQALWDFIAKAEEPSYVGSSNISASSKASASNTRASSPSVTEVITRLNWSIVSASPASEADTGAHTLNQNFALLQQGRGLDPTRACVLGAGIAGSYLALRAAASFSPAPLAVCAVGGGVELQSRDAEVGSPIALTADHEALLARLGRPDLAIVNALDRSLRDSHALGAARRGSEPWWRSRFYSSASRRRSEPGYREGKERRGFYRALRSAGRLGEVLREQVPMEKILDDLHRDKKGYPPVLVFSSRTEGVTDLDGGISTFINSLRRRDPIAAVFDDLLTAGLATKRWEERKIAADDQSHQGRPSTITTGLFDPGRRFMHRRLPHIATSLDGREGHEQTQLRLHSVHREDPSLQGEFDALEAFFEHWFERGPAVDGPEGTESDRIMKKRRAAEKL